MVPRQQKIIKNGTSNHENSNFCETCCLRYILCQMIGLQIPNIQIQTQNQKKKKPGNKHEQIHFFVQCTQQTLKMGTRNLPKSRKIEALTQKCPSLCSEESHDRLTVHQDAKVEAPSMPYDKFGHQQKQYLFPRMPKITNLIAGSNGQGPAADGVAHEISRISCLCFCARNTTSHNSDRAISKVCTMAMVPFLHGECH